MQRVSDSARMFVFVVPCGDAFYAQKISEIEVKHSYHRKNR
jgi:hypothetical protein